MQIKLQVTSSRQEQQMELAVPKEAELWSEDNKNKREYAIVTNMFIPKFQIQGYKYINTCPTRPNPQMIM